MIQYCKGKAIFSVKPRDLDQKEAIEDGEKLHLRLGRKYIKRFIGPTGLSVVAFQSYIHSGILPNIRRSSTFLLSQSVQQSL